MERKESNQANNWWCNLDNLCKLLCPHAQEMSLIGSVACEKMLNFQYLLGIFCFKDIPSINSLEEYRRKVEYPARGRDNWCTFH